LIQDKFDKALERERANQLKQMKDVYKRFESSHKDVISRKKLLTMDAT